MTDTMKLEMQMAKNASFKGIEAYGVKGMKSTPWRKTFKSYDALEKWAEKNDAEVYATREIESF